jgi:hypothetical protein
MACAIFSTLDQQIKAYRLFPVLDGGDLRLGCEAALQGLQL